MNETQFASWLNEPFEELTPEDRNRLRALNRLDPGKILIEELKRMEWQNYQLAVFHSPTTLEEFAAFQAAGKMLAAILSLFEGEDEPEEDEDA